MSCLNCIIDNLVRNDYKIPHMNKACLECKGTLPAVLKVTDAAAYMLELTNKVNDTDTNN